MEQVEERTLAILKPEAIDGGHTAFILEKISGASLRIVARATLIAQRSEVEEHYAEHRGRDYYEQLIDGMLTGEITVLILEGKNAVETWRNLMGSYKYNEAQPGTIRKELMDESHPVNLNYVHGADSPESAKREIEVWRNRLCFVS